MKEEKWTALVDLITIFWLALFITGLISTNEIIKERCGLATLCLLPVFVLDLVVLFRKEDNFKTFLKKRWFDVLLVIPYFRVFRLFRMARLLKVLKLLKLKKFLNFTRFSKKSKRVTKVVKRIKDTNPNKISEASVAAAPRPQS